MKGGVPDNQTTEPSEVAIKELRSDWAWQKTCSDGARDLYARAGQQLAHQKRECAKIEARAKELGVNL